MNVAITRR